MLQEAKMMFNTNPQLPVQLDTDDDLAHLRDRFLIEDENLIYLDGNSLGRLPRGVPGLLQKTVTEQWGERLIRAWNEGWIDLPARLGDKIAGLIGAQPGEVLVCDSTSVNLFKLAAAALQLRPGRRKIVSDELNFPSDLYIFQGLIDLLGGRHRLELIPSADGISTSPASVAAAIDGDTALVSLSQVVFKSAFLYDVHEVTRLAHAAGALALWDLSHAAGAVPVRLNEWEVDLAVGCTYKYLNGGPGAPAFLYVRRELQERLMTPLWGWLGAAQPFDFDLGFNPAPGLRRFQVGTPPVLAMQAIEPGLDLLLEAGIERLRAKSARQTDYLIFLAEQWLYPLGFSLGSPPEAERRGSHVSLRHAEAYRINRAMIEAIPPQVRVIPDFRAPDNIRLGIAPLYTSYADIYRGMRRIKEIVEGGEHLAYPSTRKTVT